MQKPLQNIYVVEWLGLRPYKAKSKRTSKPNALTLKRDEVEAARKYVNRCLADIRDDDAADKAKWGCAPNPWVALDEYTAVAARARRKKLLDKLNAARAAFDLIRPKGQAYQYD